VISSPVRFTSSIKRRHFALNSDALITRIFPPAMFQSNVATKTPLLS
jgi:hypothetical protein